jgi:transposase
MDILPLGIDISKAKFDVALWLANGKLRHKVFPNSAAGYQQLSQWACVSCHSG